jgi:hypothetical protein
LLLFSFDDEVPVVFKWKISHIVTEIIGVALFIRVKVRDVLELKPFLHQLVAGDFRDLFASGENAFQYPTVFRQCVVDVPDQVATPGFKLVIVIIPAIVITEFFICSTFYRLVATKT